MLRSLPAARNRRRTPSPVSQPFSGKSRCAPVGAFCRELSLQTSAGARPLEKRCFAPRRHRARMSAGRATSELRTRPSWQNGWVAAPRPTGDAATDRRGWKSHAEAEPRHRHRRQHTKDALRHAPAGPPLQKQNTPVVLFGRLHRFWRDRDEPTGNRGALAQAARFSTAALVAVAGVASGSDEDAPRCLTTWRAAR